MARMKIVLRQPVEKLGEIGDVVSVAGGFARNYLIPRGLAVPATKGNVKHADTWKQSKAAKTAKEKADAEAMRLKLESLRLTVEAQAGPDGRLFGSVTAANIAEAIKASGDVDVDRHAVELEEPIRHLGVHDVAVRLAPDVEAKISVEVTASS